MSLDLAISSDEPESFDAPDLSILEGDNRKDNQTVVLNPAPAGIQGEILSEADLKSIPDMNVEFRVVSDKASQLVDLREIEAGILGEDTLDQARAEIVQESFKTLYESGLPKASFSTVPTRVNVSATRKYVAEQLALEDAQLLDLYKTYLSVPMDQATNLLEAVVSTYIPGLIRARDSFISEVAANKSKVTHNSNAVVPTMDRQFVNLSDMDTRSIVVDSLKIQLNSRPTLRASLVTINKALECPVVRSVVSYIAQYRPHREAMSPTAKATASQSQITAKTLVEYLTNPQYEEIFEQLSVEASEHLRLFREMVKLAEPLAAKPDELSAFIVEHAGSYLDFHACVMDYVCLVHYLTILNLAIKELALTFYELHAQ